MDAETRQSRARLIRHITVKIHDSEANCPPLAAMWIAILTGMTGARIEEAGGLSPLVSMTFGGLAPANVDLSPFPWAGAPEWLGLDTESAMEMLRPEIEDADWRAKPETAGTFPFGQSARCSRPTPKPENSSGLHGKATPVLGRQSARKTALSGPLGSPAPSKGGGNLAPKESP